jgi:hypothetical protein
MGLDEFRPTSTEKIKLILGKIQRGLAKSRFRAQGTEAEMKVWFCGSKASERKSLYSTISI